MDRFDFKLVGKKEMLRPVQQLPASTSCRSQDDVAEPKDHINPDARALGAAPRLGRRGHAARPARATSTARRSATSTRTAGRSLAYQAYDDAGKLYRAQPRSRMWQAYDIPAIAQRAGRPTTS